MASRIPQAKNGSADSQITDHLPLAYAFAKVNKHMPDCILMLFRPRGIVQSYPNNSFGKRNIYIKIPVPCTMKAKPPHIFNTKIKTQKSMATGTKSHI